MPADSARLEEVFANARIKHDSSDRAAYLDKACGDDAQFRKRIEALLTAHGASDNFLNLPENEGPTCDASIALNEGPNSKIGRYKLLEQIGEGGFGVVFMAEQEEPVRRLVALKIIKLGMDTRQVVARFEAERQALAMMDHPNVAKVFDGGATEAGRPYFVMELVRGVPITEYCDEHHLSIPRRLELFIQVCQAVQHAHQKGLIHRDIKPTNVLVTTQDDHPAAKVIDFGVAKATAQRLTERTMFTQHGQIIGSFAYMSPEQARLNQSDVDTRTDIYSLGVLLYELLTGSTPFGRARLSTTPFDETLRIIREEEPSPPSAKLDSCDVSPSIAARRNTDPQKLKKEVRGELDWIAMKALEKDRNRRYETASAVALDVSNYLTDEPVTAAAPTPLYRVGKFIRRNRMPVIAAGVVAMATIFGFAVSAWQSLRATRAERAALSERDAKSQALLQKEEALRQALANAELARKSTVAESAARQREAAERKKAEDISNFLINAFSVSQPEQDIQAALGLLRDTAEQLQDAYSDNNNASAGLFAATARAYAGLRQFDQAEKAYRRCLGASKDPGLDHRIERELAKCLLRLGKSDEARPMLQEFYLADLRRAENREADELLAAWPGLPDVEALFEGTAGMDSLKFDGNDDYVVLPRLFFNARPPWTIEAIVRPEKIYSPSKANEWGDTWTSLISTADAGGIALEAMRWRWSMEVYTAGVPGADWTENYATASARSHVDLHQWQHVAGVWDGKELRLYLDGQLQNTRPGVDFCSQISTWPVFIGADPSNLAYGRVAEGGLVGYVRAVRISRSAEYKDSFLPPDRLVHSPGTIGLYDFTYDTGQYAMDLSGHGNHGIIIGAKFVKPDQESHALSPAVESAADPPAVSNEHEIVDANPQRAQVSDSNPVQNAK